MQAKSWFQNNIQVTPNSKTVFIHTSLKNITINQFCITPCALQAWAALKKNLKKNIPVLTRMKFTHFKKKNHVFPDSFTGPAN